jgi:hypothetical protein
VEKCRTICNRNNRNEVSGGSGHMDEVDCGGSRGVVFVTHPSPFCHPPLLSSSPASLHDVPCVITQSKARYLFALRSDDILLPYSNLVAFQALKSKTPAQLKQLQAAFDARQAATLQQQLQDFPTAPIGAGGMTAAAAASKKRKYEEVKTSPPPAPTSIPTAAYASSAAAFATPPQLASIPVDAYAAITPADESPKASKAKKPRTTKGTTKAKK